jgi:MoaA/NifB/PqqE/SkfB family radical SAM enzyme
MTRWARRLRLLRGLCTGETAYTGPYYVNIDVTHRCNIRCFYCRWHSPLAARRRLDKATSRDLSCDIFRELCQDLRAMGGATLQLVGAGEPLLHPDIFEMIRIAKDNQLVVLMYTNGTLLQEKRLRPLIGSGLDVLRVSVAATSSEEYVQKHPHATAGEFDSILSGLSLLSRLRSAAATTAPVIELTHPIARDKAGSIPAAMELAGRAGCARIRFSVLVDFGEAGFRDFALRDDEQEQVRENLGRAERRGVELGVETNVEEVLLRYRLGAQLWNSVPCYIGWFSSFVGTDGGVHVCQRSEVPFGFLSQNRFGEIWNNPDYRAFRRRCLSGEHPISWLNNIDCNFCPHAANHHRVHKVFHRVAPVRRLVARRAPND